MKFTTLSGKRSSRRLDLTLLGASAAELVRGTIRSLGRVGVTDFVA